MPLPTFEPMNGRAGMVRRNCEEAEAQSVAGKRGGAKKLYENQVEALWDEVVALNRAAGPWGALAVWRAKEVA